MDKGRIVHSKEVQETLDELARSGDSEALKEILEAFQRAANGEVVGEPLRSNIGLFKYYNRRRLTDAVLDDERSCVYELIVNCNLQNVGESLIDIQLLFDRDYFNLFGVALLKGEEPIDFAEFHYNVKKGLYLASGFDKKDYSELDFVSEDKKHFFIRYVSYTK